MTVYLFLIGLSVLNFLFGYTTGEQKKANRNSILIFFIGMVILIWLRSPNIGTDIRDYLAMYERAKNFGFANILKAYDGEYGYFALNMLVAAVYDNHQFFLLCIGLVSLVPVIIFYAKRSENALITIGLFLLFLFPMYFSGLRQICAMAFVFPAYYAAKEKKLLKFILFVVVAMTFHTSAFALALLYPVYHIKIRKNWVPLLMLVFVIIYLLREPIFAALLHLMPERYQDMYSELTSYSAVTVLLLLILFVAYTYITSDAGKLDADSVGLRNLLVLSMVLQIFASINSVAMRLNYYYLLFVPITVSKYVHLSNRMYSQVAKLAECILSVFFIVYFIWDMYTGADVLNLFPYQFYFNY